METEKAAIKKRYAKLKQEISKMPPCSAGKWGAGVWLVCFEAYELHMVGKQKPEDTPESRCACEMVPAQKGDLK